MTAIISLRKMVDELQAVSFEIHSYLNVNTGEFVTISDEEIQAVETNDESWRKGHEWMQKAFQRVKEVLNSDDYLKLSDQFEIHEYSIMQDFCVSVPDEKISDILFDQIRGSGAFRRFKNTIYQYGIEKEWFKFRDEALKAIAINWLKANELAYTDDM